MRKICSHINIIECLLQKKSHRHTTTTTSNITYYQFNQQNVWWRRRRRKISTMSVIIVIIANSVRPIDSRRLKLRQKMNGNVYNSQSHDKNKEESRMFIVLSLFLSMCVCLLISVKRLLFCFFRRLQTVFTDYTFQTITVNTSNLQTWIAWYLWMLERVNRIDGLIVKRRTLFNGCGLIKAFRLSIMLRYKRLLPSQYMWESQSLMNDFIFSLYFLDLIFSDFEFSSVSWLIERKRCNQTAIRKITDLLVFVHILYSNSFSQHLDSGYVKLTVWTADLHSDVFYSIFANEKNNNIKTNRQAKFSDTHSSLAELLCECEYEC